MFKEELNKRFKNFALRIMNLSDALPKDIKGRAISNQLLRSGTSSAANFRSACRGRSTQEFLSKLCIVEEELDESMFWLELVMEGNIMKEALVKPLYNETNELLSIIISSKKKTKENYNKGKL